MKLKAMGSFEDPDKDILGHIMSFDWVAKKSGREVDDGLFVFLHERFEGIQITLPQPIYQTVIAVDYIGWLSR